MKKEFRSFEDAKKFVQTLGLKNLKEWYAYCKSGNKPDNIPADVVYYYKNKGWNGMGDWLGTGTVANFNKQYRPFPDARKIIRLLGLKNNKEWRTYSKSGNKPDEIPVNPDRTYKKEWISWGDWLGTGNISEKIREYRSFKDARKFVRSLGIKGRREWDDYCKFGNKPDDIPAHLWDVYKKEWTSMGDFLGTGIVATQLRIYLPIDDAKKRAHELAKKYNLRTKKDWTKAYAEGKIPDNLPANPWSVYSKKQKI
jgi:hypothetical protein